MMNLRDGTEYPTKLQLALGYVNQNWADHARGSWAARFTVFLLTFCSVVSVLNRVIAFVLGENTVTWGSFVHSVLHVVSAWQAVSSWLWVERDGGENIL